MNIIQVITYAVGIGEVFLGLFFWKTNSKSEPRRVLSLLAISIGLWVIFSAFIAYVEPSPVIQVGLALTYVFGVVLLTAFVHFAIVYPIKLVEFDQLHLALLYVPALIFSLIALFTNGLVKEYLVSPTSWGIVVPGSITNLYNLFLIILFATGISILLYRYQRVDGIHRRNIALLILGVVLGGLPAVTIDLFLPIFFPNVHPNTLYGNLLSSIWLSSIIFIISRK